MLTWAIYTPQPIISLLLIVNLKEFAELVEMAINNCNNIVV